MKISQFVKDNISNLEHFIEQNGWPIRVREIESAALQKYVPEAFTMVDDLLHCDAKKIPSKVMAAFWKFKYLESKEDANKMYNAIDEAYTKANS